MIRDQAILVRPDGSVMFDSPAPKARQGAESRDSWLSRTVAKAMSEQAKRGQVLTQGERIAVEERPNPVLRDAVRINRLTGRVAVDLMEARRIKARQWIREGSQLQRFIADELLPFATWMGDTATALRLSRAQGRIVGIMDDLKAKIGTMTVEELASHEPAWPQLKEGT